MRRHALRVLHACVALDHGPAIWWHSSGHPSSLVNPDRHKISDKSMRRLQSIFLLLRDIAPILW
jgi:hypothetical protein